MVDDSGRLLDVCDIGDDPYGYAYLSTLLAERASGPYSVALAADSDHRLVPALLATAGWAVAFVDNGATDDFADRFADDLAAEGDSAPMQRRALGLARALHAGALSATSTPAPAELAGLKPLLAAHGALATGRHAAAVALREVLRELYPAALRAYPDPADPVALAVMEALPEPGALASSARGRDAAATADAVSSKLAATGLGDPAAVSEAITALRVAIAETPRRGGIGRDLTATVAETVRQAVSAVRSCDSASAALVRALAGRVNAVPAAATDPAAAMGTRATASPIGPVDASRFASTGAAEPATHARPTSPVPTPLPPRMTPPPVPAAAPLSPPHQAAPPHQAPPLAPPHPAPPSHPAPPLAPPHQAAPLGSPPATMPQPPAMEPGPPAPVPGPPAAPPPPAEPAPMSPPPSSPPPSSGPPRYAPPTSTGGRPVSAPPPPPPGITPIGEPRSPLPAPRPPQERPEPAPWHDERAPATGSYPPSGGQRTGGGRRRAEDKAPSDQPSQITPPWRSEDLVPPEPPPLRLVEPLPSSGVPVSRYQDNGYPGNGYSDNGYSGNGYSDNGISRNGIPRSVPPVSADDDDNLLIFAQTRSAWFSGEEDAEWSSRMDAGWRAAEQAASKPAVGDRTGAGLPRRVPRANLVPGSPPTTNRQLRVVRDPSSIAAHTSGYFSGWRRGQEVGGVGGYPLGNRQQSAGAWDFTRDVAQ